ncbi:DNA repair protein UVH3 isoform X3 [Manihot esculenta]|uniref:DNA repair protein UVH3 isoform X3 n=1 Tax=Manihot esculenta TaxID=3983 RepID=UPI001CC6E8F0|nr:DNA repair protein UVH3 isoform X3 [Manihot esculenta]
MSRLAASIAIEEDESLTKSASLSAAAIPFEEGSGDEEEEMILPAMCGKVDPAVLAALPPSMQLDLLVQMRERLMAENRQRYQKVKKAPEKFSELQIEAYLKTVAFRREIDQVQKAAAGQDVGGVQTSRIASEANREFIFSSSFTGDKQLFTSAGMQRNGNKKQQTPTGQCPSDSVDHVASNTAIGMLQDESTRVFDEDIGTYLDERGNVRVSRVRAMGMCMTRDLQRNLDLMKEIEQERIHAMKSAASHSELDKQNVGSSKRIPSKKRHVKVSLNNCGDTVNLIDRDGLSILDNEKSIHISFDVDFNDESKCVDSDDNIFTSLVAGQPIKIASAGSGPSRSQSAYSASDSDRGEGVIEGRGNSSNGITLETNPPPKESNTSDDSEVDWEEGVCNVHDSSLPSESGKPASKGYLEEEADLQEAIRRSLEDLGCEKLNQEPTLLENLVCSKENAYKGIVFLDQEDNTGGRNLVDENAAQQHKPFPEIVAVRKLDSMGQIHVSQVCSSSDRQLKDETCVPNNMSFLPNKSCTRNLGSDAGQSNEATSVGGCLFGEMPSVEPAAPLEVRDVHVMVNQFSHTFVQEIGLSTSEMHSGDASRVSGALFGGVSSPIPIDDELNKMKAEPSMLVNEEKKTEPSYQPIEISNPSMYVTELSKASTTGTDVEPNLDGKRNSDHEVDEKEHYMNKFGRNENLQAGISEASLQEEILNLGKEFTNLGDEQKKQERNAESVSSEMFGECQELLQMFGLPYIIAPMEAEAQCAYMEQANLVDGVVTDDSDVFLFGARNVYKNIFDDRKYVETYFMKAHAFLSQDIEKELGLTREKLIRMALLLGSDYTEGISGIGIVNAIEVVNAFPEEDGLKKFREWIESPDPSILGKLGAQNDSSVRKRGSKVGGNDSNCANSNIEGINSFNQNINQCHEGEQSADHIQEIKQIFMDKHRNVSKNWHIPSSFPSEVVISAYSCPQVDKSTELFTWGKPDHQVLGRLCWEKFGWGIQKSDELLLPVLKEYNKHETQLRLEAFYTFNERFAKIRSKRIKKAVKGITGNQSSELMDDAGNYKSKKNRMIRPGESGDAKPERPSKRAKGGSNKMKSLEKSAGAPVSSEVENPGHQWQEESGQSTHKGSRGDGKKRGRGCGRGKGRGRGTLGFEQSDSSPGDVSDGDDELEVHVEKSERVQEVRRSLRSRKPVNYTLDDLEIDDVDQSLGEGDTRPNEGALEAGVSGVQGASENAEQMTSQSLDPLPDDFFDDHLEQEVGFLADEAGSGHAGVTKNTYPSEAGVSDDYLMRGGGFCVDESETATHQDTCHSPSMAAECGTVDSSHFTGLMEETDRGKVSVQSVSRVQRSSNDIQDGGKTNAFDSESSVGCVNATDTSGHFEVSLPESSKKDAGESSVRSLSAMPFLRRKRKKN